MGTQESSSGDPPDATLAVFDRRETPGTPLTTSEVAEELDCARRTAYSKLDVLADAGELETKKVGARGRVWWRPRDADGDANAGRRLESARFRELAKVVTDYAIFVLDADGRVQTWNDGARQIKGYEEADIVDEHFSTFYTESDRDAEVPERNLRAARERGRIEDEGWRVRKDGSTFWANVTITALYDDEGTLEGYMKITQDLTERHEREERLRKERDRFETLVSEVKDYAIFLLDADGHVQTWNEGARRLKGYERDEIVGQHVSEFYTESDREADRAERNLETAVEEGRVEDEGERVRKDGSTFWANVTITALYDDEGDVRGFAKVTRDMTERHEYETRLRNQRDELDELDQINAVIRDIDQALVTATSREAIEQAVCDRLAASETYSAAWTAEYSEDFEDITPRTWAGISEAYLEAIRAADVDGAADTERGTGAEALQTQTVKPVQRLQSDEEDEPWREASLEEGYESAITVPLAYDEAEYGVLTVYADDESAFDQRKIEVMDELGETISHAIAAIRRKERERTLTALQKSTRELLHTETHAEIGDVIVRTLTEDLGLDDAVVYHFDTTENVLEPVSSSLQGDSNANRLTPFSAGADSSVWTSFVERESRFDESVLPSGAVDDRQAIAIPLGDHGVLAVAAAAQETFDENTRNLVELVAATAEAGFDRVESQANLRERDEMLREQNQRLQRLNQINTIIREVDQGLVQATSREEIERIVCDRLTASGRFRFAWIGSPDDPDGITPQAWDGDERGYLDSVDLAADGRVDDAEPGVTTARTGEVTVVGNVAENLRGGQWRKEAFSREFQSAISVPLTYGDVTYGVLTVYADRPGVFDEMERSVFTELGNTIANAVNAVDTKQALVSDQAIELEFRLQSESASVLSRLGRRLGSEISFEGVVPLTEGRVRMFFVARDAAGDAVRDVLDQSVNVESGRVLTAREDGHLVEAVMSGETITLPLLEYGASLRTLTVTDDGVRLAVDVPSRRDVRGLIERFQQRYESVELLARRERDRPVRTRDALYAELDQRITDRQREVLETAYYSGYFDSPRESTGSDVAELLGVSQPTVTEQLRAAERKVLDLLFDDVQTDG